MGKLTKVSSPFLSSLIKGAKVDFTPSEQDVINAFSFGQKSKIADSIKGLGNSAEERTSALKTLVQKIQSQPEHKAIFNFISEKLHALNDLILGGSSSSQVGEHYANDLFNLGLLSPEDKDYILQQVTKEKDRNYRSPSIYQR